MKNILVILMLVSTTITAIAQNFDEVGNLSHVSETRVTGAMFKMISGIDTDDPDFTDLMKTVDNLTDLRVYATDDKASAAKMKTFATGFITKNKMDLLMSVKEDGQKFTFHVRKGSTDTKIRELVMFIDGSEDKESSAVFLVITGDLDLNQIAKITQQMNIPGQKQIKEATQKK